MLKPIQFDFFQIAVSIEKFVKFVVTFLFHTINIDWIKLDIGRCAGWLRTRLELSSNIMLLLFTKFSKCNKIIMTLIRSRASIIHLFCRFGSSMQIIGSAVWDSRVAGPRIIGGTPLTGPHISHSGLVPKIAHLWFRAKLGLPLQNMKPVIDHEFCKKKNHIIPSLPSRVVSLKLLWRFFQCLERQIARF